MDIAFIVAGYLGVSGFSALSMVRLLSGWRTSRYAPMLSWSLVMALATLASVVSASGIWVGWSDGLVRAEWVLRSAFLPGLLIFATNRAVVGPDRTWVVLRWGMLPIVVITVMVILLSAPIVGGDLGDPLRPTALLSEISLYPVVIALFASGFLYLIGSLVLIARALRGLMEFSILRTSVLRAAGGLAVGLLFGMISVGIHGSSVVGSAASLAAPLVLVSEASTTVPLGVALLTIARLEPDRLRVRRSDS